MTLKKIPDVDLIKSLIQMIDQGEMGGRPDQHNWLRCRNLLRRAAARLRELATPSDRTSTNGEVVQAAQALVEKLDEIHDSPAYQSVWTVSQMHNGPYAGPDYAAELADLRAALKQQGENGDG